MTWVTSASKNPRNQGLTIRDSSAIVFVYDFVLDEEYILGTGHRPHPGRGPQGHRGAYQLPQPGSPARPHAGAAVLLPEAILVPGSRFGSSPFDRGAPGRLRTPRLRGRNRADHRQARPARGHRGRLEPRRVGHGQQRPRRLRPPLRRQGLQPPVQGRRRLHPRGPGPDRRGRRGPRRTADPHLAQRRTGPGRHHRRPALPLRPARRRPVPAAHPREGRHHPHRHPGRRLGRQAGRRRRG